MKSKITIITGEIFKISFLTYLILLLLETVKTGFVSNYFNMNIVLGAALVSGMLTFLPFAEWLIRTKHAKNKILLIECFEQWIFEGKAKRNWLFMYLLSLGSALVVYSKNQDMGLAGLVISGVTGLLIFILSYIVGQDR